MLSGRFFGVRGNSGQMFDTVWKMGSGSKVVLANIPLRGLFLPKSATVRA